MEEKSIELSRNLRWLGVPGLDKENVTRVERVCRELKVISSTPKQEDFFSTLGDSCGCYLRAVGSKNGNVYSKQLVHEFDTALYKFSCVMKWLSASEIDSFAELLSSHEKR